MDKLNSLLTSVAAAEEAKENALVDKAMDLYSKCDNAFKYIVCYNVGLPTSSMDDLDKVRSCFSDLALLDMLDEVIENIEWEVNQNQPQQDSGVH